MAKKKQEKKVVENTDLEVLVDEGKNIDTVKVAEIITDNTEKLSEKEINEGEEEEAYIEDIVQEAKYAQTEDIIKGIMEDADEIGGEENEKKIEDECNIDDVIAECTGEKETTQTKVNNVPWYVARVIRGRDYYNY